MGYTTWFTGEVTITPPLNQHEIDYLRRFAEPRRDNPVKLGRPGSRCQWVPGADGATLAWDNGEKFYNADLWLAYVVDAFLRPEARDRADAAELAQFTFDHVVNGAIEAEGEEPDDRWRIEVRDNTVYVVRLLILPEYFPGDPDTWTDEQWAVFNAGTRRNYVYVLRDGQEHEVGPADGTTFAPIQPAAS